MWCLNPTGATQGSTRCQKGPKRDQNGTKMGPKWDQYVPKWSHGPTPTHSPNPYSPDPIASPFFLSFPPHVTGAGDGAGGAGAVAVLHLRAGGGAVAGVGSFVVGLLEEVVLEGVKRGDARAGFVIQHPQHQVFEFQVIRRRVALFSCSSTARTAAFHP